MTDELKMWDVEFEVKVRLHQEGPDPIYKTGSDGKEFLDKEAQARSRTFPVRGVVQIPAMDPQHAVRRLADTLIKLIRSDG
jgi:hypothetical protein